jgi:hypothetical protein
VREIAPGESWDEVKLAKEPNPEILASVVGTRRGRAAMNATTQARWTPEARKAHGELTKSKMNDPAVRQRISERTKAGMRANDPTPAEVAKLCEVWREVSPKARQKFLLKILLVACSVLPAETIA